MISLKPRDWLVIAGLVTACALIALTARLLVPGFWAPVMFLAALASVLLVQFDTYRRLQGTLVDVHHAPGQNYRQIEALFSLFALLPIKAALPPLRGAAISPDFAAHLASVILKEHPETVLELGSGSSTIVCGYALSAAARGRVVSLEESEEYAHQTRRLVAEHGLDSVATVLLAPLVSTSLPAGSATWYDLRSLPALNPIDLLVVDGPLQTGRSGDPIRYPALPLLKNRLATKCTVLIDDCDRAQEQEMVRRWLAEFPEFEAERTFGEKRHIVLRRGR